MGNTVVEVHELLSIIENITDEQCQDENFLSAGVVSRAGIHAWLATQVIPLRHDRWVEKEDGLLQDSRQFAKLLVYLYRTAPTSFLEIGSASGLSFIIIVAFLQRVHRRPIQALSVDIAHPKQRLLDFCGANPLSNYVVLNTRHPSALSTIMQRGPFDFALVDADHSYDAVKNDYYIIKNSAKTAAFHDILCPLDPGCVRFWDEVSQNQQALPITIHAGLGHLGIGVLLVDERDHVLKARHMEAFKAREPALVHNANRSWDCFDTLLTRRHLRPETVFLSLETKLRLPGFASARIHEGRGGGSFDQIYDRLAARLALNQEEKTRIKLAEVEEETVHCFPIQENMSMVKDGDLIISDMYLPASAVSALLIKCGLSKQARILVSDNGKSTGAVWQHLKGNGTLTTIELHTGDNLHSDCEGPRRVNLLPSHYSGSGLTPIEQGLGQSMGDWMRYVRLQCPYGHNQPMLRDLWLEQTSLNIPILYHAIRRLEASAANPVFIYRDAVHLAPLWEKITGRPATLFHSSRKLHYYGHHNKFFVEHAYATTFGRTVVDVQGSGESLAHFYENVFPGVKPMYEAVCVAPRVHNFPVSTQLTPSWSMDDGRFHQLESLNAAHVGTLVDFNERGPVRAKCEHRDIYLDAQHAAVKFAIQSFDMFKPVGQLGGEVLSHCLFQARRCVSDTVFSRLDHPGSKLT